MQAWFDHGENRKTVVFCVDVAHARHVAEAFEAARVRAGWVSGDLPLPERRRRLAAFREGEIQVLTNCDLLLEGWDEPSVSCLVMARPTRSLTLYTQTVGSGLCPYPGKEDCLVLEMADNRHDLMSLATLEGLGPQARPARAPAKSGEPREEGEAPSLEGARLMATPMDLLRRSRFRWHQESRWRMRLEAGPGEDVVVSRQADGTWLVELRGRGVRRPLSDRPLPLEYACGVAEDYVRAMGRERFADASAPWRSAPATERQLRRLAELGIEPGEGLTRERAMEMIRAAKLNATLRGTSRARAGRRITGSASPFVARRSECSLGA